MPESALWGRSAHSLSFRNTPLRDMVDAEQEYWLNSAAMLACLCGWTVHRRPKTLRVRIRTVLALLLRECCSMDVVVAIDVAKVLPHHLAECPSVVGGASCDHIKEWQAQHSHDEAGDLFDRIASSMGRLAGAIGCQACGAHFGMLLTIIAGIIDDSCTTWNDPDVPCNSEGVWLEGRTGKKKRRVDPFVKQEIQTQRDCLSRPSGAWGPFAGVRQVQQQEVEALERTVAGTSSSSMPSFGDGTTGVPQLL